MGMIGTPEEARAIYAVGDGYNPTPPEGWQFLGSGMYRNAFLSPSGVVYKVEKNECLGYGQDNYGEYCNWLTASTRKFPEDVRLPAMTFYSISESEDSFGRTVHGGVIAMEYVDGGTVRSCGAHVKYRYYNSQDRLYSIGMADIHDENVMYDKTGDKLVLVDIGACH